MEITEVRIKLIDDPQERLQAFCSLTFDHCFVIRDLKIIEGGKGSFVAMPSRKLTDRCPHCGTKNHLRAGYCNQCGVQLQEDRAIKDEEGRAKLYADIAHPINARCREQIQARVIEAFREEQIKAKQPGYVCAYDDYGEERYAALHEDSLAGERPAALAVAPASEPPRVPDRPTPITPATIPFSLGDGTHRIEPAAAAMNHPHISSSGSESSSENASERSHDIASTVPTRRGETFGDGILGEA